MDLAPFDRQVDAVVGPQRTVGLDDAADGEGGALGRGGGAPARRGVYEVSAPVLSVPAASCFSMPSILLFMSAVILES